MICNISYFYDPRSRLGLDQVTQGRISNAEMNERNSKMNISVFDVSMNLKKD